MFRIAATVVVAIIGVIALGIVSEPPETSAHEHRTVLENYEFVVGWLNEPAIAYEPNGLDFRVTLFPNGVPEEDEHAEGQEPEGTPVTGLEETLQGEIIAGGGAENRELTLEPAFGEEGAYESPLIPTVTGDYSFRIFGEIDGQPVDETFTSGPETFSTIEDPVDIQFPELLVAPAVEGASGSDAASESSSDDTARTLGIVGIIVGAVGLAAGVIGVASARRS
jgi:hypothetical protein